MSGLVAWWASFRARYDALVAEYGWAAVGTYFAIFFSVWFGFWIALDRGWSPGDAAAASAGTIGGAYVLTKVTQPIRIGATLVLTPVVVRLLRLLKPPAPGSAGDPPGDG